MGFVEGFKRGRAAYDEAQYSSYSIAGVKVHCSHCGGEKFAHGTAMLNTRGMTFLKLDWADRSAKVLVCANCTHITWFLKSPERT